jgi:hypothetical protein
MFGGKHRDSLQWLLDEHSLLTGLAGTLAATLPAYKDDPEEQHARSGTE